MKKLIEKYWEWLEKPINQVAISVLTISLMRPLDTNGLFDLINAPALQLIYSLSLLAFCFINLFGALKFVTGDEKGKGKRNG